MSANNFWNNFSHGFMHGMFNSNPFMCSNMFYPNFSVLGGFGNCFGGGFGSIWGGVNGLTSLFTCPTYTNTMTTYPNFQNSFPPAFPQVNFDNIFDNSNSRFNSNVFDSSFNNTMSNINFNFDNIFNNNLQSNSNMFDYSFNNMSNVNFDNEFSIKSSNQTINSDKSTNTSRNFDNSSANTMKITDRYTGTAEQLNKVLGIKNGVLKGKGQKFLEMQEKYGLNAAILAAICCNESAYGTSNLARNYNNVCGYSGKGAPNGFKKFNSVDECIEAQASLLKRNYVDKGLVTVHQIHMKYCPPKGDKRDTKNLNSGWGSAVTSITKRFESYA